MSVVLELNSMPFGAGSYPTEKRGGDCHDLKKADHSEGGSHNSLQLNNEERHSEFCIKFKNICNHLKQETLSDPRGLPPGKF